jgi:hypothetical protein
LYARNNLDGWDTLADFKFPNPCPGPYPVWKASRLPITQKSNDLEISLVGLVSGVKAIQYHLGDRSFTRATFEVTEHGQTTEAWLPDQMKATDATGNEPWIPIADYRATNRLVTWEIQGASLSPTEVWQLRMRFFKEGDVASDPIWTSPKLVVQGGVLGDVNLKTNVQSYQIALECEQSHFRDTIRLKLDPVPKETRLSSPDIVDDQGRPVKYKSGSLSDSGFDAQWKIPEGAKWIQLKVRLADTRTFEFMAQPTSLRNGSQ